MLQKRTYSRSGCLECKRRKLKCDERKPNCFNCSKSQKNCSYKKFVKFSENRTLTFNKEGALIEQNKPKENEIMSIKGLNPPSGFKRIYQEDVESGNKSVNSYNHLNERSGKLITDSFQNLPLSNENKDALNNYSHSPTLNGNFHSVSRNIDAISETNFGSSFNFTSKCTPPNNTRNQENTEVCKEFSNILLSDVSNLTLGLKDTALLDIEDSTNDIQDIFKHMDSEVPNFKDGLKSFDEQEDEAKVKSLIASYDFLAEHKNYLRLFYEKYSMFLFPLSSGVNNICSMTLMNLAIKFPFVLNIILSITARYENFRNPNSVDDYYEKYYFVMCCKGFEQIFDDKSQLFRFIEPLILTTLLLGTDAVGLKDGDWRAHLKAAHKLFRDYVNIYKKATGPAMLLSTVWFAAFEILAVLANPLGGTITSQTEFNFMMNAGITPKDSNLGIELGLILPNGYNVFLGYSVEAINMFITFVRVTLRMKESKRKKVSPEDLAMLICQIKSAGESYFASKDCIIKKDNPYHPNNATGCLLPIATYGSVETRTFSWFDISHKVHVQALYLKILTDEHFLNLPVESDLVQDLVREILDCLHFFERIDFEKKGFSIESELSKISNRMLWLDRRMLTVHWPLLTCGFCSLKKTDKLKIEMYFRSVIKMGARSLERSFLNIKNKWKGRFGIVDYVPFV